MPPKLPPALEYQLSRMPSQSSVWRVSLLALLLLAALLPLLASVVQAAADTHLHATISDARTGTRISHATIAVQRDNGSTLRATTGDDGSALLVVPATRRPYERVTITIDAAGYGTRTLSNTLLYPAIERRLTVTLSNAPQQQQVDLPTADSGRDPDKRDTPPPAAVPLQQAGDLTPPATIRVARTGHKDCAAWLDAGRPVLRVETVPFREYVKNVLPNEWIAGWQPEALKAGALAVKMYAWRHILIERRKDIGADIVDNTCDQYYVPGTQQASTDAAVDETWDYVLQRNKSFLPIFYLSTRDRCTTSPYQPCMPQWGTQEDAQAGDSWQTIVQRYYGPADLFWGNLGQPTPSPTRIPAQSYSYAYVEQNPISGSPLARISGSAIWEVRLRNTGTATWYRNRSDQCNIYLGTGEPGVFGNSNPLRNQDHISPLYQPGAAGWLEGSDTAGKRIFLMEEQVPPGAVGSFRFAVAAPDLVGELRPYFTPLVGGVGCSNSFWLPTQGIYFTAEPFPFSYELVRVSPAAGTLFDTPQTFELVLRNTGTATWYRHPNTPGNPGTATVRLATGMPTASSSDATYLQPEHRSPFYVAGGVGWLSDQANRIVMQEERVAPGQQATFRFAAQPPADLEDMLLEAAFTPYVEGRGWFSHQAGTRISVQLPPRRVALQLLPADLIVTPGTSPTVMLRASTGNQQADQIRIELGYDPALVQLVDASTAATTTITLAAGLPLGVVGTGRIDPQAGRATLWITSTGGLLQGSFDLATLQVRLHPNLLGTSGMVQSSIVLEPASDMWHNGTSLNPQIAASSATLLPASIYRTYLSLVRGR